MGYTTVGEMDDRTLAVTREHASWEGICEISISAPHPTAFGRLSFCFSCSFLWEGG